jgi:hypothetical protein
VRIARGDGLRWWSVGFSALSVGSVPTLSPLRVDDGGFSRLYPTRDVQSFCLPLLSLLFSRDFRRWWSYWRRGPGLLRWLP